MIALKCLVLLVAVVLTVADYQLDERTGHSYKFHNRPKTWENAFLTCVSEGGYLAIINSQVEAQVLKELFAKYPTIVGAEYNDVANIGYSDRFNSGIWRTIQGESLHNAGYSMWHPNKPDNLFYMGEYPRCGSVNRLGLLDDNYCHLPYAFICEKEPISDYLLDERTGHRYKFHNHPMKWENAFLTCVSEGGYLAIINSQAEAQVLKDLFAKYPTIVGAEYNDVANIGYSDRFNSGIWKTIQGESLHNAGYSIWHPNKPDNLFYMGEYPRCGSVNRLGLLDDNYCHLPYAFICEKEPIIKFY